MHEIERMWRHHRRVYSDLLDKAEELTAEFRRTGDLFIHPQVAVPYKINNLMIRQIVGVPRDATSLETMSHNFRGQTIISLIEGLTAFAAYRSTKRVYQIDPVLIEILSKCEFPLDAPMEALRLPVNGCVIELPYKMEVESNVISGTPKWFKGPGVSSILCYYNTSYEKGAEQRLAIRFSATHRGEVLADMLGIFLHQKTLAEGFAEFEHRLRENNVEVARLYTKIDFEGYLADIVQQGKLWIMCLLYITGHDDVVKQVHPGERPRKETRSAKKQRLYRDLSEPDVYLVGSKRRAIIERWEAAQDKLEAQPLEPGKRRPPRPHIRAAHTRTYWTGPRDRPDQPQVPVVRFIMPSFVRGGEVPDDFQEPADFTVR